MDARAVSDVVVDRRGEGVRLLEHHADARAQLRHIERVIEYVTARRWMRPRTRAPGLVSVMRVRQRRKVDLPHPEGPISARTWRRPTSSVIAFSACFAP